MLNLLSLITCFYTLKLQLREDFSREMALTEEEFQTCFAHAAQYGNGENWPHQTILFYSLSINGNLNIAFRRVDNTPQIEHAEITMIRQIEEHIQGDSEVNHISLKVYSSYSPCNSDGSAGAEAYCADALYRFQSDLKKKSIKCEIEIRFSSFYMAHDATSESCSRNRNGLIMLIRNRIQLEVFNGEQNWKEFLRDIGKQGDELNRWVELTRVEERITREQNDVSIRDDLINQEVRE